jgi:hypothetical protein
LEEIDLELLVDLMVFKLAVHSNVAMEAPIPIFPDCFVQSWVGHQRPLEQLQEPVGCGHEHVVVIAIIVGGRVDLLHPGDFIQPMLFGESHNATVGELLDPVSRLPHPILDRDRKAWAAAIVIEYIPVGAFFGGERGTVVDETCLEEFEFFPLSVTLPGPLFAVLLMLPLSLLEGSDEATSNVTSRQSRNRV